MIPKRLPNSCLTAKPPQAFIDCLKPDKDKAIELVKKKTIKLSKLEPKEEKMIRKKTIKTSPAVFITDSK